MSKDRGQWSSRIGFIFAAAGSAIGLGNVWRFPYMAGQNGGAAFVFTYLICVMVIGLPVMLAELSLGRSTTRNPVGAIEAIKGNSLWRGVGILGVVTGVAILSYYAVIAGWTVGYMVSTAIGKELDFNAFVASPGTVIFYQALFMLLTILVVSGGVQGGIERWAKILMPLLLLLLVVLIIRSVTLKGSLAGIEFYLKPDFSKLDFNVVLQALGQAFFSLSLGMGLMITYGSYLSKEDNMVSAGLQVALFDTLIAIMAGFVIFPALFAVGENPAQGPGLVFVVLPKIFKAMPLGNFFGAAFFLLLAVAALTSTISLLEVPVAYFVDEKKWTRTKAVWILGLVTFLVGIPSALSLGASSIFTQINFSLIHQKGLLSIMDFIWGNFSLALGAFLLSIFVGWIWGGSKALAELRAGTGHFTWQGEGWLLIIKFICPIVIAIILLNLFL